MKTNIKWWLFGGLFAVAVALGGLLAMRNVARRTQVYHPGIGGVGYPTCAFCPNPTYPEKARTANYEGNVLLQAVITPDGHATEIKVIEGPDQGLGVEQKAVEVLQRWKFHPASGPSGKPVAVQVPIQVAFHLADVKKPG